MRRRLALAVACLLVLPLLSCGQKGDPSPRRDLHRQVKPAKPSPTPGAEAHG